MKVQLPDHEQEQRQEGRVDHGTCEARRKQQQHVTKVEKSDIDPQDLARKSRDQRVTRRGNQSDSNDDRPFDLIAKDDDLGDDDAREQDYSGRRAGKHHQRKHDAEARIPGSDGQALVNMDEADPCQNDIGNQANSGA